jgi:predicted NBD/HSP70 family sugar kinase
MFRRCGQDGQGGQLKAQAGSPSLLRQWNATVVLRKIREQGPISRTQLAKEVGLSNKTVNDVTEFLLNEGFIRDYLGTEDDRVRPRGPVPRLFTFCADLGHVLGVDVGANKIVALVADLAGQVVGSARRQTSSAKPVEVLAEVQLAMTSALEESHVDRASLKAVAVGTPGVVDSGLIRLAPQLGDWEGVNLRQELDPLLPCPVLVENEAHLSILAEKWRGAARGIDDALYLQLGVGVGAALLIKGEAYGGANGAAGEIGYLPLFEHSRVTHDDPGPFETAVGGTAYARLGRAAAIAEPGGLLRRLAGGDPSAVDAKIVFAAAGQGDPAAHRIVKALTSTLARGIATAVVLLDPAAVILGGGLSRAGDLLLEPLNGHLGRILPAPPRLVLSALGSDAVALGAVRLACEFAERQLFEFASADANNGD